MLYDGAGAGGSQPAKICDQEQVLDMPEHLVARVADAIAAESARRAARSRCGHEFG